MRRALLLLTLTGVAFCGVALAEVSEPSEGQVADCSRVRTTGQSSDSLCLPWLNPYSR